MDHLLEMGFIEKSSNGIKYYFLITNYEDKKIVFNLTDSTENLGTYSLELLINNQRLFKIGSIISISTKERVQIHIDRIINELSKIDEKEIKTVNLKGIENEL